MNVLHDGVVRLNRRPLRPNKHGGHLNGLMVLPLSQVNNRSVKSVVTLIGMVTGEKAFTDVDGHTWSSDRELDPSLKRLTGRVLLLGETIAVVPRSPTRPKLFA